MDERINKKISQYISLIKTKHTNIEKALLFGSFAKYSDRDESDIDIAIVFKDLDDSQKFDVQVQLLLLASQIDSRIEPHPLSADDFNSDNPFAIEIRKTGIEITR
ncbi:MAG: nucleotidyltransferase domain-containing protein [Bacteroidetes bacterium]|nr:MAG: nucleotidyltransferase domain-containing protein [Bacteroidota bacterium]